MRGIIIMRQRKALFSFKKASRISLSSKLVSVQYRDTKMLYDIIVMILDFGISSHFLVK